MMPSVGDQIPVRPGNGIELGLFNGLVQAGVQRVQDIQDGDEGRGGGSRLDDNAPGKPRRDNMHNLSWRVCSGHRKVRVVDLELELVWVWWKGNIETNTLWVGKEVMERGWNKRWRCQGRAGAGMQRNNWALLCRRKSEWCEWPIVGRGSKRPSG